MSIKICPSMLSADPLKLGEELRLVEKAGADCIHWDIMDGCFVDAITFGSHVVASHRKLTNLRFDVHLMVQNPDKHIKKFADSGADVIIVHPETCNHIHKTLSDIKFFGKKAGLALNPATPVDVVEYCDADVVLVMSVNPGRSGQSFIESQFRKISELKRILPSLTEICVDGGITDKNIKECVTRGADSFVTGAYLFGNKNYETAITSLRANC